tara:strand:- start:3128 stop:3625 length:498 start_codon:yes stop_codon:yes gene_type:complete
MSLRKDIEEAYIKALGVDPENKGNIPELAEDLTNAIVDFLQKQTFTITKMESVLQVEEIKTTGTLKADVLDKVKVKVEDIKGQPSGGDPSAMLNGTGEGSGNVVRRDGKEGVKIPKLDLRLSGGQGGALTAIGKAYIGSNPVDSREKNDEHGDNRVKLLKVVGDK